MLNYLKRAYKKGTTVFSKGKYFLVLILNLKAKGKKDYFRGTINIISFLNIS